MVNQEIINDYLKEISLENIAIKNNCSRYTIKKVLKENNIPLRTQRIRNGVLSFEEQQDVVNYYNSGVSAKDIAVLFNVNTNTIGTYLKRRGVNRNFNHIRLVNNNPFEGINDNGATDYWLGFIVADGHLEPPSRIALYSKDLCVLNQFKQFLNANVSINKMLNKQYNSFLYYIRFNNKEAYDKLKNLNITPNKSLSLNLKFNINWAFIHGLFDGDGSFCFNNKGQRCLSICSGSKLFADKVLDFYTKEGINAKIQVENDKLFKINIYNKTGINTFFNNVYLQQKSQYCLARKRDKFLKYINGIGNGKHPNTVGMGEDIV